MSEQGEMATLCTDCGNFPVPPGSPVAQRMEALESVLRRLVDGYTISPDNPGDLPVYWRIDEQLSVNDGPWFTRPSYDRMTDDEVAIWQEFASENGSPTEQP